MKFEIYRLCLVLLDLVLLLAGCMFIDCTRIAFKLRIAMLLHWLRALAYRWLVGVSYVYSLSHVVYHPWVVLVLSLKGTFRVVNTGSVRVRYWPDQILLLWSHGVPPLSGLEVVFLTSERWQRQWLLRKWNPLLKFLTSSIEIAYWKIYLGISFSLVVILITTIVDSRPFPCSITGRRRVHRL